MTAEVLVMNTSAAAMAADTAVSIPYRGGTKTYTRARKLLPLHESEPIAVMVSDAPDHFTLPWEVIVGEFRKKQSTTILQHLDNYVEAFFTFVDKEAVRWISTDHQTVILNSVLNPEIRLLQRLWAKRLDAPDRPKTAADVKAAAAEVCGVFAAASRERQLQPDRWTGREADDLDYLDSNVRDRFEAEATGLWDNLDRTIKGDLIKLGRERLLYIVGNERGSSRLVFAGYGSDDLFAHAQVWRVSGRLGDKTRCVKQRQFEIGPKLSSVIVPVAQEGVIYSFLRGLHPEVDVLVDELVRSLANERGGPDLAADIKEAFDLEVSKRQDEVARAVEFLPAGDLAVMAGDLIRMTALRNRATMTADTVGGPIDIVLLSRTEGLRWVGTPGGIRAGWDDR